MAQELHLSSVCAISPCLSYGIGVLVSHAYAHAHSLPWSLLICFLTCELILWVDLRPVSSLWT